MKLTNIQQVQDFLSAVDKCEGSVWLESPDGDKFNLKSKFSQYIAMGALLSTRGNELELFCSNSKDERYFYQFFSEHPEVR